jgi:hypothetical protein
MRGIANFFSVLSTVSFTSNVTLATVGLSVPIKANQRIKFRAWVKITVGAAGGVRLSLVAPIGVALYQTSIRLNNTVAPSSTIAVQAGAAAFTNALANAGTHWVEVEGVVIGGAATDGVLDLQFAQNTSDATPLQVLAGSSMETIVY